MKQEDMTYLRNEFQGVVAKMFGAMFQGADITSDDLLLGDEFFEEIFAIYGTVFTDEEISDVVEFNKKYRTKTLMIQAELEQVTTQHILGNLETIESRLEAKLNAI